MTQMGMRMRKGSEMTATFLARTSGGCRRDRLGAPSGTILKPSGQKPEAGSWGPGLVDGDC